MRPAAQALEALLTDELARRGTVHGLSSYFPLVDEADLADVTSQVFIRGEAGAWLGSLAMLVGDPQIVDGGLIVSNSSLYGWACPTCSKVNTFTGEIVSAYSPMHTVWHPTSSVAQQAVFYNVEVGRSHRVEARPEPTFVDQAEQLVLELGRLQTGWDGQGGEAPSTETVRTLSGSLAAFPSDASTPEVEVDGSDGSILLRWYGDEADAVLTVSVLEDQLVVTVTSRDKELFGRVFGREEIARTPRVLLERFEHLGHG